MRKIRKFTACIILLFSVFSSRLFCQAALTFDVSNWIATLNLFYQGYDQIMSTLQLIDQNYQQFQQAIEEAKSWNFDEVEWDGDLDFRNELYSAGSQVNDLLTNVRQAKNALTTENITVNGSSFSLADIAGFGDDSKNIGSFADSVIAEQKSKLKEMSETLTKKMTPEEKAYIWSQYGISPENYYMLDPIKKETASKTAPVLAAAEINLKNVQENGIDEKQQAFMKKIMNLQGGALTEKEIQQMSAAIGSMTLDQLQNLTSLLADYVGYTAWNDMVKKNQEEAEKNSSAETFNKVDNVNF